MRRSSSTCIIEFIIAWMFLLSSSNSTSTTSTCTCSSLEYPSAFVLPSWKRPSSSSSSKTTRSSLPFQRLRGGSSDSSSSASSASSLLQYNASTVDAGSLDVDELLELLRTNTETGLSTDQVQERLAFYGPNTLDKAAKASLWELIAEQFDDRLVQILVVVAMVSGVFSVLEHTGDKSLLQSFVEPLVIMAILICNAAVGVWQSQSASDSLDALQELQPTYATVLRHGGGGGGGDDDDDDHKKEGGVVSELLASELVPGDIVQLRVGDKIPADARLLELKSSTLQVDETSLTGESVTVSKLPAKEGQSEPGAPVQSQLGMVFSGTMITSGNGLAVVVQTGMATQFGKIQQGVTQAKESNQKTPLALKLDDFGHQLTYIIGGICIAVWVVSIPKMSDSSFSSVWEGAIYYAKVAVALGVAAIPEGLPAVITLCLSLGTRRMAQRNVIVRKLPSVETLGCTSVICTDKTGTLTTNEMTAVSLVFLNSSKDGIVEHDIDGTSYSPIGMVEGMRDDEMAQQGAVVDIAAVAALCNDATILGNDEDWNEDSDDEDVVDEFGITVRTIHHTSSQLDNRKKKKKKEKNNNKKKLGTVKKAYDRTGEPTEAALCVLCEKLGGMEQYTKGHHFSKGGAYHLHVPPSVLASANVNAWRAAHPRMATLEFHRERKSMSVLASFGNRNNRLLVKGAPNLLLERCTHIKDRNGKVIRLSGAIRRQMEDKITELATRPLRCLALAVKDGKELERSLAKFDGQDATKHALLKDSSKYKDIESGLTLVGIVGIKDPARPEVADSIQLCTKAGIRVMMITGDARDTAIVSSYQFVPVDQLHSHLIIHCIYHRDRR
jgi:Ca2+-transporting ATPase